MYELLKRLGGYTAETLMDENPRLVDAWLVCMTTEANCGNAG